MNGWVLQEEDRLLPSWLGDNLSSVCQTCGSPMMNYYNEDRCTNRRCSNPKCLGAESAKAEFVHDLLGIKGKGKKTFLKEMVDFGVENYFELIGRKPTVSLGMYLRMHCFEGIDSVWEQICVKNQFYTLDELFAGYEGKYRAILDENKELLYSNLQYVNLTEKPANHVINHRTKYLNVMITGTPIGYSSKEAFIDRMNELCHGRVIITHQKSKRQSGVDFLIREEGSTTRGKVEAARRGGIPIITSGGFITVLTELCREILSEESAEAGTDIIEGGEEL